ncbi:MAG: CRISPR-associated protein Csx15 [Acidobacteriota bacterium]
MIVLNFAHPFTASQFASIARLAGAEIERVIDLSMQFEQAQPFAGQASVLLESVGFSANEWQTLPLLINLPSFNVIAALVLAELHGRMGYFPAIVRLRPIPNVTPPQFEVAEIINLQAVRDAARQQR